MTDQSFLRRPLERLAQLPAGRRLAVGLTIGALVVTLVAMALLALQAMESAGDEREHLLWTMGALVVLAVVTGTAIGVLLSGGLKAAPDAEGRIADRLAEGDLGADLDAAADDEVQRLQQAVAEMQERLRTMVGAVREAADGPKMPAPPARPARQAPVAPLERVDAAAGTPAGSARDPDRLVASAVAAAERGGQVVSRVVAHLDEISSSSRKIGEIVSVIDHIAFQTNLLALNAAVQAAKAGAQGGGFAVVAGEVRGLAQRAANAAKEIKSLVSASTERVESGSQLARDANATMEHLMVTVQSVTEIIGRLGQQPSLPAGELAQVSESMHKLEELTQRNETLALESASAAEALRSQAERLQKVVGAFRLLQQTQEAAWTAHNAISSARERARGSSAGSGVALWGQERRPPATPGGSGSASQGDWENF